MGRSGSQANTDPISGLLDNQHEGNREFYEEQIPVKTFPVHVYPSNMYASIIWGDKNPTRGRGEGLIPCLPTWIRVHEYLEQEYINFHDSCVNCNECARKYNNVKFLDYFSTLIY